MPCCCACKFPLAIILGSVLVIGGVAAIAAGPDDKKVEQPKTDSPKPTAAPQDHMTVDLNLHDEDLKNALSMIATQWHASVVPSKAVSGKVTLTLKNAKFREAIDALMHAGGCGYVEKDGAFYVYTNEEMKSILSAPDANVLAFTMKRIDGASEDLSAYKGKVVLMVNVASRCGYTKQYAGLEKLYESKKADGLVILGFPANEFGKQEPGTNAEIKEFCSSKFSVTFPMFEKIVVKGEGTAPLYLKLAAQPAPIGGEPKWNFTKFLVDRTGNVVARFEPGVAPDDAKLAARIDELLKAKPQDNSKARPKQ